MKNMNFLFSFLNFLRLYWNYCGAVRFCILSFLVSLIGLSICVLFIKIMKFFSFCFIVRFVSIWIKVVRIFYIKVLNILEIMRLSMKRDVVLVLFLSGFLRIFKKVVITIFIVIKRTRVRRWESYIFFRSLIFFR